MDRRKQDLIDVQNFIGKVDAEMTMILQQLQWDRSNLLKKPTLVNCKYDSNHRIPIAMRDEHETQCFFITNGYTKEDKLLPDPIDTNTSTLIKLSKNDIETIIDIAARADPPFKRGKPKKFKELQRTQHVLFKLSVYLIRNRAIATLFKNAINNFLNKGTGSKGAEPMSLERLQATYSADERRAIYDAVVKAAPSCHDLSDLALLSGNEDEQKKAKQKSRLEILAELRDMKRRRTKYRVAAKTRNYSDLLRDVIKTQMEVYTEVKGDQLIGQQKETKAVNLQNNETRNEISEDKRHSELDRSRDRSRDNRTREHSRHDFVEYSKRRDSSDKYHQAPSSSKRDIREVDKNYIKGDGNNKKRKRTKSPERLDRGYKSERNFSHDNNSKADSYINKDTRIKKEKIDETEDMSGVEFKAERHSRHNYDKKRHRHSYTDKNRLESKNRFENGSCSSSSYYMDNVNQNIKQEDDRFYETGTTSKRSSYDEYKYRNESNKVRHEDIRSYESKKREIPNQHKEDYHSTHKSTNRDDRKREEETRYRRYYD